MDGGQSDKINRVCFRSKIRATAHTHGYIINIICWTVR